MARSGTRRLLVGCVLLAVVVGPILWFNVNTVDRPVPTRAWDETIAAMDANPDVLQAFLAERTFVRNGEWDYRWMPEPFRHVWATLRFERGSGPPGPDNPTTAEAAEAYRAFGLTEVAELVVKLGKAQEEGGKRQAEAQACVQAITMARPRILAARKTYLEAHRGELDTP